MTDRLTEKSIVEDPFLATLSQFGWDLLEGDDDVPALTGRASFADVLLRDRLRAAIQRLNVDADRPNGLSDTEVERAVAEFERVASMTGDLLEINRTVVDALVLGVRITPDEGPADRYPPVKLVDFGSPDANEFLAISQFRVDPPGGGNPIIPDIVLFLNGIPVVVIECKAPDLADPMEAALDQLLRYSDQRGTDQPEGAPRLFAANIAMVATCFDDAVAASIGTDADQFRAWRDTYPRSVDEVATDLGRAVLSQQDLLAVGMLHPENLLDLIRVFTVFPENAGRLTKKVARYQQFRAVGKALEQLKRDPVHLPGRLEDGRGGVVFHYQGSGKTLTMVYLVRKMRVTPNLRRFKVVLVVDRINLQDQLGRDARLAGDALAQPRDAGRLSDQIAREGRDLVLATIQKWRDPDSAPIAGEMPPDDLGLGAALNTSDEILIISDESHRSNAGTLHANLIRALPNAAKIGFTGTPVLEAERRTTEEIFGPFLDIYRMSDSEADGVTVPILYEGREGTLVINNADELEEQLKAEFPEATEAELAAIRRRYVNRTGLLEAPKPIAVKARDILRDYVATSMPNGFRAMVATASRVSAARYRDALLAARDALVAEIEARSEELDALDPSAIGSLDGELGMLARAREQIDLLRRLDVSVVISDTQNQLPMLDRWTNEAGHRATYEALAKPLGTNEPEESPLAIVCVKNMLLTGFDEPRLQALYLDRPIRGADLFQAVGRVNRDTAGKTHGRVVDYYGLSAELAEVVRLYSEADGGVIRPLTDQLPILESRAAAARAVLEERGLDISTVAGVNDAVDTLADPMLRAAFNLAFDELCDALDAVLPRPEALPYVDLVGRLGHIRRRAQNRYRDSGIRIAGAARKVQRLIDQHLEALGIVQRIEPLSILDKDFPEVVGQQASDRSKALEMEHAARHYIRERTSDDPVIAQTLAERLQTILDRWAEDWEQLSLALAAFVEQVRTEATLAAPAGIDPSSEAPFWRFLAMAAGHSIDPAAADEGTVELTHRVVAAVRRRIGAVDFWRNSFAQETLRAEIVQVLDDTDLFPFERIESMAGELMALAKARHTRLVP
jgi:type I restriction enzyme R subunit